MTRGNPSKNRILNLITELRRRRVCRAATMYAVVMWLICQIVDLTYKALGLPDWTLKFVIVLGLLGFPIALILSWLLDITPEGLRVDVPERAPDESEDNGQVRLAVDFCLLAVALFIGLHLVLGEFIPGADTPVVERIAVHPISVSQGPIAAGLSQGLFVDLQHELAKREDTTVIAPSRVEEGDQSLSLTGALSMNTKNVRVTVMMIDNDTGVVTWSRMFLEKVDEESHLCAKLARDIVSALPMNLRVSNAGKTDFST